jgi:hypothetical protein
MGSKDAQKQQSVLGLGIKRLKWASEPKWASEVRTKMYYPLRTVSTPSAFSPLKQQLLAKAD